MNYNNPALRPSPCIRGEPLFRSRGSGFCFRLGVQKRLNIISILKGASFALILFVAVYAPAFAIVAWLHPSVQVTIPIIIIVSGGLAVAFIAFLTRDTRAIAEFGVAKSPASYVIAATLGGIVVAGRLPISLPAIPRRPPSIFQSCGPG